MTTKTNEEGLMTQDELCDMLRNMISHRVEVSESLEEVRFCIEDAIEEWQEAYNVEMTGG